MAPGLFIDVYTDLAAVKGLRKSSTSKKGLPDSEVDTDHPYGMGVGSTPDDPAVGKKWHKSKKSAGVEESITAELEKDPASKLAKHQKSIRKSVGYLRLVKSRDVGPSAGSPDFSVGGNHGSGLSGALRQAAEVLSSGSGGEHGQPGQVGGHGPAHEGSESSAQHKDPAYRSGVYSVSSSKGGKKKSALVKIAKQILSAALSGRSRGKRVSAGSTSYKRGRIRRPRMR